MHCNDYKSASEKLQVVSSVSEQYGLHFPFYQQKVVACICLTQSWNYTLGGFSTTANYAGSSYMKYRSPAPLKMNVYTSVHFFICRFVSAVGIYEDRLSISLWLYSALLGPGRFFSFFIFYTVCMTPWKGDQPVARPLPAHRTAQTE
jgi:hypothetical protein